MNTLDFKYLGEGIYTIPDAANLTGITRPRVRHWIRGDLRNPTGGRMPMPPIVETLHGKVGGIYTLSFLDLVEILMVEEFRKVGVSVRAIRLAHEKACDVFQTTHPFALQKFWTDGREILADIGLQTQDPGLLILKKDQFELRGVTQMFLRTIDTSESGVTMRWWPMERSKHVVLDPTRSFGQPIVEEQGVQTIILAHAVKAEGSISRAANWYMINAEAVENAYKYETTYTRRLAA